MGSRLRIRNVLFAVLGATILVLKPLYQGPFEEVVYSYAGNFSVSFTLYFAAINAVEKYRRPELIAALATLLSVELFEISNGFGVMTNVFDSFDLLVNAAGVFIAVLVDAVTTKILNSEGGEGGALPRS